MELLKELIKKAKEGNKESMLELINKFEPLLKKYAKKLNYDDAINDLIVYFIELIKKINLDSLQGTSDGYIVAYIRTSEYNHYIYKLKEIISRKDEILFTNLSDSQKYFIEAEMATYDDLTNNLSELYLDKLLNDFEYRIIIMIFSKGYSSAEIARIFGTSRQSVNQTKNRALKKIKVNLYE